MNEPAWNPVPVSDEPEVEALKTAFLAIISHELRTPLTEIIAASSALGADYLGTLNENQREYLTIIQEAANHLDELIGEVIEFARLRTEPSGLSRTSVLFQDLVSSTVDNYKPRATQRKIKLLVDLESGLPPLMLDVSKISRVVANLMENALNYTPEGGRVMLTLRSAPGQQCLDVADTGRGIPVEKQAHIFESFYQADSHLTRQVGGLGIGLAYARQIVEAHQGTISFTSTPNEGSIFTISLPSDGR